jgi:hypothetical protein
MTTNGGAGAGSVTSVPPKLSLYRARLLLLLWIENGEGRGRRGLLYPGTISPGW